jgi:6-phosphogluconolactonase
MRAGLAATIAGALSEAIEDSGAATLAVSGGSTPARFFEALAHIDIDWSNVAVLPVDERFVPETSERSNARLIKSKLLQGPAVAAKFLPFFSPNMDAGDAAREADDHVGRLGIPLDVVVLGMGNDGHTASFFPDAQELEALLDASAAALVLPVHADSAGEDRLTLTLPPIATARCCHAATSRMVSPSARLRRKVALSGDKVPNLGIITSYNDMLSAHQPFETFPN